MILDYTWDKPYLFPIIIYNVGNGYQILNYSNGKWSRVFNSIKEAKEDYIYNKLFSNNV